MSADDLLQSIMGGDQEKPDSEDERTGGDPLGGLMGGSLLQTKVRKILRPSTVLGLAACRPAEARGKAPAILRVAGAVIGSVAGLPGARSGKDPLHLHGTGYPADRQHAHSQP